MAMYLHDTALDACAVAAWNHQCASGNACQVTTGSSHMFQNVSVYAISKHAASDDPIELLTQ